MTRREMAKSNFLEGYNCAQSLVLAFADMLPYSRAELARMACSFGGGMARLREVCGSVSGMFLVIGILYGYETPETGKVKAEHYARVQELARRFLSGHRSIVCRELLGLGAGADTPIPEARTPEYYAKRPCAEIVGDAAEILDLFISEQEQKSENPLQK